MPFTLEQAQAVYDKKHGQGVVVLVAEPTPEDPGRIRLTKGPKWEEWNAKQGAASEEKRP